MDRQKSLTVCALMLGAISLTCMAKKTRIISMPEFDASTSSSIGISGIELSDTATVLDIHATYIPHYWIKFASSTVLKADGKEYKLKHGIGIEPDKEFWMPDEGQADFRLVFEPLPKSVKSFDLIESDDWKIFDVDVTGKRKPLEFPDGLPKELCRKPIDGKMPMPVIKTDSAKVNLHILGYRPDLPNNLMVVVDSPLDGQNIVKFTCDEGGEATVSFPLNATSRAWVAQEESGYNFGGTWIDPGETVNIYVRPMKATSLELKTPNSPFMDGKYADLASFVNNSKENPDRGTNILYTHVIPYDADDEKYADILIDYYKDNVKEIESSDMPRMLKDYMESNLRAGIMYAACSPTDFQRQSFLAAHDYDDSLYDGNLVGVKANTLNDEALQRIGKTFDMGDPYLLITGTHMRFEGVDWAKYGASSTLPNAMGAYTEALRYAKRLSAPVDSLVGVLRSSVAPGLADRIVAVKAEAERKQKELQESPLISSAPDVADDNLFKAIVEPYKGKVVLVDLWNTWCGPCRYAIKQNEPLKSGELASDDIVWIYLADISSDPTLYMELIPGIKGKHYRLSQQQIGKIREQYNVDGIPFYILVKRDGAIEAHPDFRDHDKMKNAIKEALKE